MEAKLKNVELCVGPCKKLPDIAVIMGIQYKCDKHCLSKLQANSNCGELYDGAESAARGFALYEVIRDKFIGSPLELSRTRVSRVSCNALNGKFLISWNTQGTASMLRKTVGLALSTLNPPKLFAKYAENMKLLGGKSDRKVFNMWASDMIKAINKSVKFAVAGKIKTTVPKLKELLSKVVKKQPKMDASAVKDMSKPAKHSEYKTDFPTVKVSGIAAVATADYIRNQSGGMGVDVYTDKIIVSNQSWTTKQKSLRKADRVKNYVRQKYEKLDTPKYKAFACVLAYLSITQGFADCCTVSKLIKSKPSPSSMVELIKKAL
jgi:hypothetical protein